MIYIDTCTLKKAFGIERKCPTMGDNEGFSIDCKAFGWINITHNVVIGAGEAVVKDIDTPPFFLVGIPARLLSVHNPDE